MLAGGKTGRLYEALVHRTGIAQDVSASQQSLRHGSVFSIRRRRSPGTVPTNWRRPSSASSTRSHRGPTEAELAAVNTRIRAATIFDLEHPAAVANRLNHYDDYLGDPGYLDRDLQRYAEVDAQDVRRFATDALSRDRRLVVRTEPGEKVLPPDPPAPPAPAGTAPERPPSAEPWRNTVPGLGPAAPMALPGAQRFELDNGLPVYLVESHDLPITVASLVSRWGSAAEPAGRPGLAAFTADLLDEGTQTRDALGIAREIDSLGRLPLHRSRRRRQLVSVAALSSQMGRAMAVMSDIVRAPAFPPAEIDRVRGESLVALQQQGDDPVAAASTVMSRELYGRRPSVRPHHRGGRRGIDRDHPGGPAALPPAAFTPRTSALILSGDLTADQARALATEHFGSWSGTGTDPRSPGPPSPASERVFVVDLPGSTQTTLALAQPGISVTDPDSTAMRVMNAVLGGGFTSRINVNLRERHGYTYGASSSLDLGRDVGLLTLQTNVSTESTAASIHELLNEVAAMRDAPVGAEELARAKDSLSLSLPADFATGSSTAAAVGQLYLANLPADYYQNLPAAIAQTTPKTSRRWREHTCDPRR